MIRDWFARRARRKLAFRALQQKAAFRVVLHADCIILCRRNT